MNWNRIALLLMMSAGLTFSACNKEEPLDNTPQIELVDVTPLNVVELEDSIEFTIFYRDNDGDLGENNADVENLFIRDNRIAAEYPFRIPQLAPDDATIAIQGTLKVKLNNTGITDGSSSQSFTYTVYMVDRAGNKSNEVESPTITVTN